MKKEPRKISVSIGADGNIEVLKGFRYLWEGAVIGIPSGFISDLASVPRILRPFIGKTELGALGPILHDALYRSGGRGGLFSRAEADRIFLVAMGEQGVGWLRRWVAYVAVRLFAWGAWQG